MYSKHPESDGDVMSSIVDAPRVDILGIQIHNVTRAETLTLMERMIEAGEAHMICTPNADHVVRAQRDSEFREIIERADLVVADGMAIVYAARILGTPFKENVGGRLLLPAFAQRSAVKGYRLFLLGGSTEDVAKQAVVRLRMDYPGVNIVGTYTPPYMPEFDEGETGRMLRAVNQAKPDVLFVCLGTPKQEKWIARNLKRIEAPVSLGIGAALDVLAGKIRQPPAWMTKIGLEWLFRLVQEPKRLARRYLWDDPRFLWLVLQQRFGPPEDIY